MTATRAVHEPTGELLHGRAIDSKAAWQHQYVRWLVVSDAIVVTLAVLTAQRLRFGEAGRDIAYWDVDYTVVSAAIIALWLTALTIARTRSPRVIGAGVEEYRRVWSATLSAFGLAAIASMVFKLEIARGYLAIALPVGLIALFASRLHFRRLVARRRRDGRFMISVLAVGSARSVRALCQSLAQRPSYGYAIVGVCIFGGTSETSLAVPGVGELPIYGDEGNLPFAISMSGADSVALTAAERLGPEGIRNLSWDLEKLDVDLVVSPGVVDVATPRLVMQPVAGLPLIHLEKPQYNGTKRFEKRAFDFCFAFFVLVLVSPLLLLTAAAIKATSRGPVFYMSERIGLEGKPFRMFKFRTMVADADQRLDELLDKNESEGGVLFKLRVDPRVTSIGTLLRRYSIDELPQLLNVLRREMSMVGPRPPLAREVATYDQHVRRRLLVLPGITGLWQISGRSNLSWDETVRLDLSYVENWSIVGDVVIVFKTFRAVLASSGAY